MDIAFNSNEWIPAAHRVRDCGKVDHPDWHGLQARLWAARQAWQVLGRQKPGSMSHRTGSFHQGSADCLTGICPPSHSVNQNDSANRNRGGAIVGAAAGSSSTGGRG